MSVHISSEIGTLQEVIIHSPGPEVENMTPQTAERALYSDILNLNIVNAEYAQFKGVLERICRTFEVRQLLEETLQQTGARDALLEQICRNEHVEMVREYLAELPADQLARQLIEGVPLRKNTLTSFLNPERYSLRPLHNFFFTRDTAFVVNDLVFVSRLGTEVREREALIMDVVFNHHPELKTRSVNPFVSDLGEPPVMEGGDFLMIRRDILVIGIGSRTNSQGVDYIIENLHRDSDIKQIIVQELPLSPESFIHLDMVFTQLDVDIFMMYEPVILNQHDFQTIRIDLDGGRIQNITEVKNIPEALGTLGISGKFIQCGGSKDPWVQEREQWHSGANFFAIGPGRVMGYRRNVHTLEALSEHGFNVLTAQDILDEKDHPDNHKRCVVTIEGSELARGGGGCRCMTLPLNRSPVEL